MKLHQEVALYFNVTHVSIFSFDTSPLRFYKLGSSAYKVFRYQKFTNNSAASVSLLISKS